jgi:hypothetical protein
MSSGIFEPDDLAAMQAAYEDIISQPWFSDDPEAKKAFARYLLDAYPGGTYRPELDRPILESVARAHYGRSVV